jgi:hypothetical protein
MAERFGWRARLERAAGSFLRCQSTNKAKFEARNPKFETNSKRDKHNAYNVPNSGSEFSFLDFPNLNLAAFVLNFDIRISDLPSG